MTDGVRPTDLPLVMLVAMLLLAVPARAQEASLDVVVTYIAGTDLYLDAGADEGVADGDTLAVYRDGAYLGDVRVVSSTASRAVVTFAGDPFPVTRGTVLRVTFAPPPTDIATPSDEPTGAPEAEPAAERPSLLGETDRREAKRPEAPRKPRLDGRLLLQMNSLRSVTSWSSSAADAVRLFLTPTLALRAAASHLPGDVRVDANLRASYRYDDAGAIGRARAVRVYSLSVRKAFDFVQIRGGRFYNTHERFSGYWDGLLARVGGRSAGFGLAAGFQPEFWNEQPFTTLPKVSAFADYAYRSDVLRYDADVSFHQVRPRDDRPVHTFAGLDHGVRWRGARLDQTLQVDRDPATGSWVVSRLLLRGTVPLLDGVQAHARYSLRQPYSLWRTDRVFADRRDELGGGLYLCLGPATVTTDVRASRWAGGRDSYSGSASLRLPQTRLLDLGFAASASYWTSDDRRALHLAPGLSRSFGAVRTRLAYRYYRTVSPFRTLTTHAADLSVSVPLGDRLRASMHARSRYGGQLSSYSLFTTLWTTF